jgi:hypothetical protein
MKVVAGDRPCLDDTVDNSVGWETSAKEIAFWGSATYRYRNLELPALNHSIGLITTINLSRGIRRFRNIRAQFSVRYQFGSSESRFRSSASQAAKSS